MKSIMSRESSCTRSFRLHRRASVCACGRPLGPTRTGCGGKFVLRSHAYLQNMASDRSRSSAPRNRRNSPRAASFAKFFRSRNDLTHSSPGWEPRRRHDGMAIYIQSFRITLGFPPWLCDGLPNAPALSPAASELTSMLPGLNPHPAIVDEQ